MVRRIYPDVHNCRALIIDGNPTARSILVDMLKQMGVEKIQQASRVVDARKALEDNVYDIVLCDYHFDNGVPGSGEGLTSGQDLLDDLRRSQILPFSTVFIMVTAEASYHRVADAAEAALDSYVIKPHTAAALEERLLQARHRKKVLRDIFEAIESGNFHLAAAVCLRRYAARGDYWMYAARIGAELFLRLGQHREARQLYESVQSTHAVPWAKLGIARAELDQNQLPQAKRTLESLIAAEPTYADAYDVMGRVQIEQGDMGGALDTFRKATNITPHSITRLQKQAMLAFLMGENKEASELLQRTVRVGISSKMFDCQSLVMLCLMHFDLKESKDFQRTYDNLAKLVERSPNSSRLRRFLTVAMTFKSLTDRRVADCVGNVRRLTADMRDPDFDFEAACNVLAVLARLSKTEIQLPDAEIWVATLGNRFCVSKSATEVLAKAAQNHESYEPILRDCQSKVTQFSELVISRSVQGAPKEAVEMLINRGAETLNAKLIELAGMVLNRHREKIEESAGMAVAIDDLRNHYCSKGTQVNLGHSSSRSSGGISLRTRNDPATHVNAPPATAATAATASGAAGAAVAAEATGTGAEPQTEIAAQADGEPPQQTLGEPSTEAADLRPGLTGADGLPADPTAGETTPAAQAAQVPTNLADAAALLGLEDDLYGPG
jgi:CheY-like chemotaxis protein